MQWFTNVTTLSQITHFISKTCYVQCTGETIMNTIKWFTTVISWKTWFIFQNSVFFVFLTNHDMCISNDRRKCDHSLMTLMSLHVLLMCTGDTKVFQVIFNCHRFFTYKIRLKSSSFLFISRKFYFLEINWSSSNNMNAF